MSDYSSVFQLVSDLMQKEKVSCILIGGFAVNFYKVSRNTTDVDFLTTKEDFDKILSSLIREGFQEIAKHENFAQFKSSGLGPIAVDFMFVDQDVFVKMKQESQRFKIGKNEFLVPSLNHLIALKLHSIKCNFKDRIAKDFPDIIGLIRINHVNVNDQSFKELCLRFGSEDIYQRILEVMK